MRQRKSAQKNDHYYFHMAIIFVVAVIAAFLVPPVDSRFLNSREDSYADAFKINTNNNLRNLIEKVSTYIQNRDFKFNFTVPKKPDPFRTMNSNYDFSRARPDNSLVPAGWYFGDTTELSTFPFQAESDLNAWNTEQIFLTEDGLYLNGSSPDNFIFTPTYKFSSIREKSQMQVRATISYTKAADPTFTCCAKLTVSYSSDGVEETISYMDFDDRNSNEARCLDTVQVWQPCTINLTVSGEKVTVVGNFYPVTDNIKYMGMLYYFGSSGVDGVTLNQVKLETLAAPGQFK